MEDAKMNSTVLFTICVLMVAAFGLYLAFKKKRQ
jgi:LPXTG-motif cell wall-anchored protein